MDPSGTPTTIYALISESIELGRDGFLQRYPHPWLVAIGWRQTAWGGSTESTTSPETGGAKPPVIERDAPAWVLCKRDRNDLGAIILGRSPRSDVVVPEPGISKMHAHIERTDGGCKVTDTESRNGTSIDGETIEPLRAVAVTSGQLLTFGPCANFLFLSSDELWTRLGSIEDKSDE